VIPLITVEMFLPVILKNILKGASVAMLNVDGETVAKHYS
jgi:hypothetical protein